MPSSYQSRAEALPPRLRRRFCSKKSLSRPQGVCLPKRFPNHPLYARSGIPGDAADTFGRQAGAAGRQKRRGKFGGSIRADMEYWNDHFEMRWLSRMISFTMAARRGSRGFNAPISQASASIFS
jgi:hypothetical protein